MTDYTKLVEALRECSNWIEAVAASSQYAHDELMALDYGDKLRDAADAIEALQKTLKAAQKNSEINFRMWKEAQADIKRLKEVINELREAQTYIDHYGDKWLTSAKDVPTAAYEHGYADGWDEAMAKMEAQDGNK